MDVLDSVIAIFFRPELWVALALLVLAGVVLAVVVFVPPVRKATLGFFHRYPRTQPWALLAPGFLWLALFFLVPLCIMFAYSFMERGTYGGVKLGFTFEHYLQFFDLLYIKIIVRSLVYALVCTALCLLLGYPVAYAIARGGRFKGFLLFLVVLPFWTSFLVRTFAMIFLMRNSGLINSFLIWTNVITEPIQMMNTPFAVMLGLIYGFLPFMVLPIYTSLEKLDLSLLEAAEVLGARPIMRFVRVTLPLSKPGMIAGSLLVFIPAIGSYLTSDLLGGSMQTFVGNVVANQFGGARNWPFGAALSFALMSLVLGAVMVYLRVRDTDDEKA